MRKLNKEPTAECEWVRKHIALILARDPSRVTLPEDVTEALLYQHRQHASNCQLCRNLMAHESGAHTPKSLGDFEHRPPARRYEEPDYLDRLKPQEES